MLRPTQEVIKQVQPGYAGTHPSGTVVCGLCGNRNGSTYNSACGSCRTVLSYMSDPPHRFRPVRMLKDDWSQLVGILGDQELLEYHNNVDHHPVLRQMCADEIVKRGKES